MTGLKTFVPRSLYARFLLIIILPVILTQLVALYIFYERHWSSISRNMSRSLSGEIAWVVNEFSQKPVDAYSEIIRKAKGFMGLEVKFYLDATFFGESTFDHQYQQFEQHLRSLFGNKAVITYPDKRDEVDVRVQLDNGVLHITTTRKRLINPTTYIFTLWIVTSAVLLLIVAILFLRNQVRSIMRLTEAAEKFGKGQDTPDFRPQGAKEVRRAAVAFIEMRERIKRLLTRRTQMLAGISHDLRTPLTRMKLQLEMLEGSEAKSLKEDVQEMEKMLEGYLDFVRGEGGESTELVDLKTFVDQVVEGYHNHAEDITSSVASGMEVPIKVFSMKRCFTNLIDNALRYGGKVQISAEDRQDSHIAIYIDDDGPSVPEEERENVFQPFYRLEQSRNQATGGIGLGLAITRDIVHRHGGEVSLTDAPSGGLRVVITLPV